MPMERKPRNTRSEIARAAAAKARAIRRAEGGPDVVDSSIPSLFLVRVDANLAACRWEIRRFGAVVLCRSERVYTDPDVARSEGERALTLWLSQAPT